MNKTECIKKESDITDSNKRIVFIDYLRIFAILIVILLHVSAQNWYKTNVNGLEWQTFNFFDSIARWGVPVFVMISGALFLEKKNIPIKKIYSKYILRMVIVFFVWSFIYMIFMEKGTFTDQIKMLITGQYHMWFIPMIIGLYMCIPFIKPIVEDEKKCKYYLIIAFIFAFAIPQLILLIKDFGTNSLIKGSNFLNETIQNMHLDLIMGFSSYFILGYYLNNKDLNKKQRIIIYILGLLGFLATILLNSIVSIKTQKPCLNYYNNFSVNVLFESIAVFTFFKYRKLKQHNIILKLSKYSFGAYLVHVLIIEQLKLRFGLTTLSFNPILSVISIVTIVFVISYVISTVLNHIPFLKKYIV